jgi:hypothetical protein
MTTFWREMAAGLPDDIYIVFREADGETFDLCASLFDGHPITIWIYPGRNHGWLGTFCPQVRMARTFWRPGRRDYYYLPFAMTRIGDDRVQRLAQQEYVWATDRPDASDGFTLFSRYYEVGGREISPYQRERLIPRICRILYGESAVRQAEVVAANLSLNYVMDPRAVAVFNHGENLDDPYKYMEEQAAVMGRVGEALAAGLEAARPNPWNIYYYRYLGLGAILARLEATAQTAGEFTGEQLAELQERADSIRARSDEAWARAAAVDPTAEPPYKGRALEPLDGFQPREWKKE